MKIHREKVKNTGKTQGILSWSERGNPARVNDSRRIVSERKFFNITWIVLPLILFLHANEFGLIHFTSFWYQEKQLEYSVIEILERANAADYVPTFARHRITIETMYQMDEEDLKQVTMTT